MYVLSIGIHMLTAIIAYRELLGVYPVHLVYLLEKLDGFSQPVE